MFFFYSSIMDHSLQYSIYYWLWLFLSLNAALLVLVCSQCSTTRHSACLWRYISHLVFGILPVGSLMFSWQTVCHQVLAAGHLKPRSLGPFYEREWNTRCMWISMCVRECRWNHEVVFERICMHMCRGQILSHMLNALRICARSLREGFFILWSVWQCVFWHAGPREQLTVQTTRGPLHEVLCLCVGCLGVYAFMCDWHHIRKANITS